MTSPPESPTRERPAVSRCLERVGGAGRRGRGWRLVLPRRLWRHRPSLPRGSAPQSRDTWSGWAGRGGLGGAGAGPADFRPGRCLGGAAGESWSGRAAGRSRPSSASHPPPPAAAARGGLRSARGGASRGGAYAGPTRGPMRHSLSELRAAASGGESPPRRARPAPRAPPAEEQRPPAETPAESPAEAMEDDLDFLSGLELAELLEPGLGSPSGGGGGGGDEAAAAEMRRFSDLLQRLLGGGGGSGAGAGAGAGAGGAAGGAGGAGAGAAAAAGAGAGAGAGGGEKRRRKGGPDGPPDGPGPRSPRGAAAAAARLNRLRKKEYVAGLESRARGLAAENLQLRAQNRQLGRRVRALQDERRHLRAVLANDSGLARLLGRLSGAGLRLTSSLLGRAPAGDHDYALPLGKPPGGDGDGDHDEDDEEEEDEDDDDDGAAAAAGGVCLHVDKDKVSVEFCAACARKAASSLKIFFFR